MHFVDKAREQLARPLRYETDLEQLAWDSPVALQISPVGK